MRTPLLIVNPACGARSAARGLPRVLERVEQVLGDVVIRYTARRGHAHELAFEGAREGYPLIVAVGGDGTFSEVANGVLAASAAAHGTGARRRPARRSASSTWAPEEISGAAWGSTKASSTA